MLRSLVGSEMCIRDRFIIDVRRDDELEQVRLSTFDLHIGHEVADTIADEVPDERDVVVMCHSGMRSQLAIMLLNQSGVDSTRLFNLTGGIMAWMQYAPEDVLRG